MEAGQAWLELCTQTMVQQAGDLLRYYSLYIGLRHHASSLLEEDSVVINEGLLTRAYQRRGTTFCY